MPFLFSLLPCDVLGSPFGRAGRGWFGLVFRICINVLTIGRQRFNAFTIKGLDFLLILHRFSGMPRGLKLVGLSFFVRNRRWPPS